MLLYLGGLRQTLLMIVNIGSGNRFVLSDIEPWPRPMLTLISVAMYRHKATMRWCNHSKSFSCLWDRLIFNMGIPILIRRHLYIETPPLHPHPIPTPLAPCIPMVSETMLFAMLNTYTPPCFPQERFPTKCISTMSRTPIIIFCFCKNSAESASGLISPLAFSLDQALEAIKRDATEQSRKTKL